MAGANHSVDIRIQWITFKHLFHLLSDIVTIQSRHVTFPVLLYFCRPGPVDNHAYTDCRYRLGRLESRKGC